MAAAPVGRRGKGLKAWTLQMTRSGRCSGRRRDRSGRRTATSKHRKLEQKRAAAGVGRKDHTRREEGRNLNYRLDFGAREPLRASALSAPGELRRCGWRCLLRRRTSLRVRNRTDAARCEKYSAIALQASSEARSNLAVCQALPATLKHGDSEGKMMAAETDRPIQGPPVA